MGSLFCSGGPDALDPWKPELPPNGEVGVGIFDSQGAGNPSSQKETQGIHNIPYRSTTQLAVSHQA